MAYMSDASSAQALPLKLRRKLERGYFIAVGVQYAAHQEELFVGPLSASERFRNVRLARYMGGVFKWLHYGSFCCGSDCAACPFINFTHFGNGKANSHMGFPCFGCFGGACKGDARLHRGC